MEYLKILVVYARGVMRKLFYKLSIFILFLCSFSSYGQNEKDILKRYFSELLKFEYQSSKEVVFEMNNYNLKEGLVLLSELLYYNGQNEVPKVKFSITTDSLSTTEKFIDQVTKAYYHLYYRKKSDKVYSFFLDAYETAKDSRDNELLKF